MDELVDIQIAHQLSEGSDLYKDYKWIRTPLLNYAIALTVGTGRNSFETAVSARKLMWIATVIIFVLTYLIARQVHHKTIALLAFILLCSFTTFLDRSIRVRADVLSTLLSMPALWIVVCPTFPPTLMLLAGFFLGLAVLATQKAIYFVLAFGVALIGREFSLHGFSRQSLTNLTQKILLSFSGFLVPIVLFVIWLHQTNQLAPFIDNGFFHAVEAGLANQTYKESTKIFLKLTLLRNLALWYLGLFGIVLHFKLGIRNQKKNQIEPGKMNGYSSYIALSLWMMTLLILIVQHNAKFPYVFINIAPSIAICASLPLYHILLFLFKEQKGFLYYRNLILTMVILLCIFIPPAYRHFTNLRNDPLMAVQQAIMNRVDSITQKNDAVFDGIGIAVTRKKATPYSITARWYNERRSGNDYNIVNKLKETMPKVMIWNYRMRRLTKEEKEFVLDNFISDWANVFIVGKKIRHEGPGRTKKTVNLLSSAEYVVFAEYRHKIRIDGHIPDSVIFLSAGDHEVIVDGQNQDIRLIYLPAVKKPLAPEKPFSLFPSYED
jgi:lipoprotein signal peptidase